MTGDSGSATVWGVAASSLLWLAALTAVLAATARFDRDRAATAADLAALAAAANAVHGTEAACDRARRTAEANRASLDSCEIDGHTAEVAVSVASVLDLTVDVRSRAGIVTEQTP
ncbi:Rv3654c family TadE-like protein [Nocardiopsis algeriensis]|uniref:Secretion/DNA translocation related TadE-like protein n=1 Tax=Nocardiopsis algeriensis TaxID=1478215 RepID=A0A841ITU6_9ACTN|nr:secretion/DNA translocation related TadE-like protein [Nocardiopsis algeriensis]